MVCFWFDITHVYWGKDLCIFTKGSQRLSYTVDDSVYFTLTERFFLCFLLRNISYMSRMSLLGGEVYSTMATSPKRRAFMFLLLFVLLKGPAVLKYDSTDRTWECGTCPRYCAGGEGSLWWCL